MKDGLPDTPSQADWLCKVLPSDGGKVGVDPFLLQVDFSCAILQTNYVV